MILVFYLLFIIVSSEDLVLYDGYIGMHGFLETCITFLDAVTLSHSFFKNLILDGISSF